MLQFHFTGVTHTPKLKLDEAHLSCVEGVLQKVWLLPG